MKRKHSQYLDVFKPTTITFLDREILERQLSLISGTSQASLFYFKNYASSVAGLHHTENLHLYND